MSPYVTYPWLYPHYPYMHYPYATWTCASAATPQYSMVNATAGNPVLA